MPERRLFGVPPATGLLVAGGLAVALAVYLLLTGRPLAGLIVLVPGVLLLAGFPANARRPDESAVARRAVRSYDGLRERATATLESLAARADARRTIGRLTQDIEQLEHSRASCLQRLGEAAYADSDAEVERLRAEIAIVDAALDSKRAQAEQVRLETDERVGEARLRAQPTERLLREDIGTTGAPDEATARAGAQSGPNGSPKARTSKRRSGS